jgi:uncharacterized protein (TIGR03435 family)
MRLSTLVVLIALPIGIAAQQGPSFDAVSIRRHVGGDLVGNFVPSSPGRFRGANIRFAQVLPAAWDEPMGAMGIKGMPGWFFQDGYDVEMIWPEDTPREQVREMWRAMFAERMKLAVHYETVDDPSFELVVASRDGQLGPGLKRSDIDCDAIDAALRDGRRPAALANGAGPCAMKMSGDGIVSGGIPMSRLALSLTGPSGRQVLDKTGLEGRWEFVLQFSRLEMNPDVARGPYPLLAEALQKQLGLKLVPVVAKNRLLVIDHVERPTEN